MKIIVSYFVCLTLAALFIPAVYADLSYVQTSDAYGVAIPNKPKLTTKFFQKGLKRRFEVSIVGLSRATITLTQCGSNKITRIDSKHRVYSIYSKQSSKKDTKTYALPFKVIDLGKTSINGQTAQHRKVEIKTKMYENPVLINFEVWSSQVPMTTCSVKPIDYSKLLASDLNQLISKENTKFSGDLKSLGDIYRNVPLRQEISMNSIVFGTTNTTELSTNVLSKALFDVPLRYRQVSNKQFELLQAKEFKD